MRRSEITAVAGAHFASAFAAFGLFGAAVPLALPVVVGTILALASGRFAAARSPITVKTPERSLK
ncbi:hypothetical protein [Arthrobacter sp. H20]|uniref:hypothetical protein n=1 Tax=Arthrobacter sp. H20 TaxID=1267981 RepID=UPI00047C0C96|nr:hypothetical protein [Arthrobacter sp. H20]